MNVTEEVIRRATKFLNYEGIEFVNRGVIGRKMDRKVEVIFPVVETLDPDIASVDPSDVRVWVYLHRDTVSLIEQM